MVGFSTIKNPPDSSGLFFSFQGGSGLSDSHDFDGNMVYVATN